MSAIPKDSSPDSSLSLLREGYMFIANRARKLQSDAFETRLMLKPVWCVTGEDAAEMFYHPNRFTRVGAMPPTVMRLLQDKGSVQQLDAEAHNHRKSMFMSLMTRERVDDLLRITLRLWREYMEHWPSRREIVVIDEAEELLTAAGTEWAGVPVTAEELHQRTAELSSMINHAGSVGPGMVKALMLRERSEKWAREQIKALREGRLDAPPGSAVHTFATSTDPDGERLPIGIAAIELINVLRPIVAVARYVTYAAHALEHFPGSHRFLTSGDEERVEWFAHEVRRYYPFFPYIGGIVREPFRWRERDFKKGDWVILDLYGTNHDPRIWDNPESFDPARFEHWDDGAYNFIPQGGGDVDVTHRCAGEQITIALLKQASSLLATGMHYTVPTQDMSIDLSSMPARPKSGMILRNVRMVL